MIWFRRLTGPIAVTAFWLAWGLVNVINYRQMSAAGGAALPWRHLLLTELASTLLWVPTTLLAIWLARRWPLGRRGLTAVGFHLAGLAATIVGRAAVVTIFNNHIHWYPAEVPPADELLLISVYNNLFLYVLITVGAHALFYARAHRAREAELARAQLKALRAQIQPHFLFNTLNTIAALVPAEPRKAEDMIAGLGDLLRRSLDGDGRMLVPLAEELAVLRSYLDIEQTRFADRLTVTWNVEPQALAAAVPPLLLQPLAENAVIHGLWPRSSRGELCVAASVADGRLTLELTDDGVGLRPGAPRGIGLSNTVARLNQLYGSRHDFSLRQREGGGVVATIGLPYRILSGEVQHHDPDVAGRRRASGPAPAA